MYVEPRKIVQMNRFAGQKLRHRCREQTYGHQGGKTGVGWGWWEGDASGRRYGDICVRIADSLCYTAETNTTL